MSLDRSHNPAPVADSSELAQGLPADPPFEELVFPTTVGQKRFWSLDALQPGNPALNMPLASRLVGRLDRRAVQLSLDEMLRRHEVLRCRFEMEREELVQVVQAPGPVDVRWIDCTGTPLEKRAEQVEAVKLEEGSRSFNLARGPLLRAAVATFSESEHVLMMSMHHIVSDGWSNGVLLREFAENYTRVVQGQIPPFDDLPLQYADFSVWQQDWLKGPDGAAQRQYWNDYLGSEVPALNLPTDHPRGRTPTHNGTIHSRLLSLDLSDRFRQACQRENATPFMGYLAAYVLLLYRYSGRSEFVIGSPAACRNQTELEGMIGLFANPVLFRPRVARGMTFRQLLHHVRDATLANFSRQEYPFELLAENLRTEESRRGVPWLQAYFIFQKAFLQPQSMPDLELTPLRSISPGAMFEWMLGLVERSEGVRLQLEFNTDLFEGASMDRALVHLERIVSTAARDLDFSVDALTLDESPVAVGASITSASSGSLMDLLVAGLGENREVCLLECGERTLKWGGLRDQLQASADPLATLSACVKECVGGAAGGCPTEVVSTVASLAPALSLAASDRVLSTGSLENREGWEELLLAWSSGATVVRPVACRPSEVRKASSQATVVFAASALISACLRQDSNAFTRCRLLVLDSEDLQPAAMQCLKEAFTVHRLPHPTTRSTTALFRNHPTPTPPPPHLPPWTIMAVPGWTIDLVDRNGNVAPAGVPGRLRLTHSSPASEVVLGDWMRIGAAGILRWLGNGLTMERTDRWSGELSDLVKVAQHHAAVWSARVGVAPQAGNNVILHVVLRAGANVNSTDLLGYLSGRIPAYMVPAAVAIHTEFPVTADGAVDQRALDDSRWLETTKASRADELSISKEDGICRDPIETRLSEMFSELLRVSQVDPRLSFFELGGHSLLAVKLFARIEQEFKQRLPLATLLSASSVRGLADCIRSARSGVSPWRCLVPISTAGDGPKFFCVHGAGGNVLLYRDLARHLAPQVRFYGLQAVGLDGETPCLSSIQEMAERYLREILIEQPNGPYHLGGYCMGGNIAYEIAQLLIRRGEEVRLLALLDTFNLTKSTFTGSPMAQFRIWLQKLGFHFDTLLRLNSRDRRRYLAEKYRMARELVAGKRVAHSGRKATSATGNADAPDGFASVQLANHAALRAHRPQPYAGTVTVFRPNKNYYTFQDPDLGWGDLVKGPLETLVVARNPHTMLIDPFVEGLVRQLAQRMVGSSASGRLSK